jgi:hypothetical protein
VKKKAYLWQCTAYAFNGAVTGPMMAGSVTYPHMNPVLWAQ